MAHFGPLGETTVSDSYKGHNRKNQAKIHRDARRNEKKGWMKYNQPKAENRDRIQDKAA
jgi:hypothetical protein